MKNIYTLVEDIYAQIRKRDGWFSEELIEHFSMDMGRRLSAQLNEERVPRLRLSQLGPRCPRALWNSIHRPELKEHLPPWAEIKYTYGHMIEALMTTLAKASGHEVTGEQDELDVDGIKGHRDCVIDGCIVDVKSASSRSFEKFRDKSIAHNDSFGYLEQLDAYLVGSLDDPSVRVKDRAFLLAVDKQLGHVCLYEHKLREAHIRERVKAYKEIVERDSPPPCQCGTEPYNKSGNIALDTKASYESFKYGCFPHLRCFLYSNGPVYLTHVAKRPTRTDGSLIPEVDRHGKIVYN